MNNKSFLKTENHGLRLLVMIFITANLEAQIISCIFRPETGDNEPFIGQTYEQLIRNTGELGKITGHCLKEMGVKNDDIFK